VATDDGLIVPVIRNAEQKSLRAISAETRDLAGRARERKLKPDEMTGATFSVSNLGMLGIKDFCAIINPPEAAILAVGTVRKEPVVKGDKIVVGQRMSLTLSCDHRSSTARWARRSFRRSSASSRSRSRWRSRRPPWPTNTISWSSGPAPAGMRRRCAALSSDSRRRAWSASGRAASASTGVASPPRPSSSLRT
jgi:hypothetical protein